MHQVLLVIHLLVALALVGVVLVQRSEGGGLGIGGGGGGGIMSIRGTANVLTRATAVLAAAFMAISLILAILATSSTAPRAIVDDDVPAAPSSPASADGAPAGTAPAPAAGAAAEGAGPAGDSSAPAGAAPAPAVPLSE